VRKVSLGIPSNFKVINDGSLEEGPIHVSTDSNPEYRLKILRGRDVASKVGDTLTISNARGGNLGGYPFTYASGESSRISDFLDPFTFKYSDKKSPKLFDYYTQSSNSVVNHQALKLPRDISRYRDIKPFSFNGDLYILAQTHRPNDSNLTEIVLLKYSDRSGSFNTVKIFSEILVDTFPLDEGVSGSPDSFEHDGKLHVVYRSVDRNLMTEKIVIFKMLDENDNFSWRLLNTIDVTKSFPNLGSDAVNFQSGSFRLRAAFYGDVSMIVFFSTYSVKNIQYDPSQQSPWELSYYPSVNLRDARSYVSYDGFNTYTSNQKDVKGVNLVQSSQEVKLGKYSNLFNFFDISYYKKDGQDSLTEHEAKTAVAEAVWAEYSVKFDVYYDNNLGSFVIFKCGDKSGSGWEVWRDPSITGVEYKASEHLIAIKTSEGSFDNWERLLIYPMDNSGVPRGQDYSGAYKINDLSVVSGDFKNKIVLSLSYDVENVVDRGIYHSDFSFIPSSIVKKDVYSKDIAVQYGIKSHPDFIFYFDGVTEKGAIQSIGGKMPRQFAPNISYESNFSIDACKYRNQFVCIVKQSSMSTIGEWGNIGEYQGYSFTHSCAVDSLIRAKFSRISNVSNVFSYFKQRDRIVLPTTGIFAYFEPDFPYEPFETLDGNLRYRTDFAFSNYNYSQYFKIRFNIKVETPEQIMSEVGRNFTFLEINKPGTADLDDIGFKLNLYNIGGQVRLRLIDSFNQVLAQSIDEVNISDENEFIVSSIKIYENQNQLKDYLTVWIRGAGEVFWKNLLNVSQDLLRDGVINEQKFRFGIVSRSFIPLNFSISIGSFSLSPTVFSDHGLGIDSFSYYNLDSTDRLPNLVRESSSKTNEIEMYGNFVELHDGSKLQFNKIKYGTGRRSRELVRSPISGTLAKPQRAVQGDINNFRMVRARANNSISNLTNSYGHIGFDFTKYIVGNSFSVLIENVDRKAFNFFSIINACGFYGFKLEVGRIIGDEFVSTNSNIYTVPFFDLHPTNVEGNYAILDQEFPEGQLVGYNAFVYDNISNIYLNQVFVKSNFNNVIQFNSALPDMSGKEIRLFVSSASFDVPEIVSNFAYNHIKLTFFSNSLVNLAMLGEICFGFLIDLSDVVGEYSESLSDSSSLVESVKGRSFPSLSSKGPIQEIAQISVNNIFDEGRFKETLYVLNELSKSELNFPMIIISEEGWVTQYGSVSSGFNSTIDQFLNQVNFSVSLNNWDYKSFSDRVVYPPIVSAEASDSEVFVGQTIQIFANFYDIQGEYVTIDWTFEDGSQFKGSSIFKSFDQVGSYSAKVVATNESGLLSQYILPITVKSSEIAYYELNYSQPIYSNKNELIYLVAKDSLGNTVLTDSSTKIFITEEAEQGSLTFDLNRDGNYSLVSSDTSFRLTLGSLEIPLRSSSSGIKLITFTDSFGVSNTFEINFEVGVEIIASTKFDLEASCAITLQAASVFSTVFNSFAKANAGFSSSSTMDTFIDIEVEYARSLSVSSEGEIVFRFSVDATYDVDSELYSQCEVLSDLESFRAVRSKLDLISDLTSKFDYIYGVSSNLEADLNLSSLISSDCKVSSSLHTNLLADFQLNYISFISSTIESIAISEFNASSLVSISATLEAGTDVFKDIDYKASINSEVGAEASLTASIVYDTYISASLHSSCESSQSIKYDADVSADLALDCALTASIVYDTYISASLHSSCESSQSIKYDADVSADLTLDCALTASIVYDTYISASLHSSCESSQSIKYDADVSADLALDCALTASIVYDTYISASLHSSCESSQSIKYDADVSADLALDCALTASIVYDTYISASLHSSCESSQSIKYDADVSADLALDCALTASIVYDTYISASLHSSCESSQSIKYDADVSADLALDCALTASIVYDTYISASLHSSCESSQSIKYDADVSADLALDCALTASIVYDTYISASLHSSCESSQSIKYDADVSASLKSESQAEPKISYSSNLVSNVFSISEIVAGLKYSSNFDSNLISSSNLQIELQSIYSVESHLDCYAEIECEIDFLGPPNKRINSESGKMIQSESGLNITIE
jgi:hypothetical protein